MKGADLADSGGVINAVSTFLSDAAKLLNMDHNTDADNGPVSTAGAPDDVVTLDTHRVGGPHATAEGEVGVGGEDVGWQGGGSMDSAYPMTYDVQDDLAELPSFSFETLRSVLRRSELRREGSLRF